MTDHVWKKMRELTNPHGMKSRQEDVTGRAED